jgi:hypothetical protein
MARIDLDLVQQDLVDLIASSAAVLAHGVQTRHVFYEASEMEVGLISNMPLINVRLISTDANMVSLPDSEYEMITFSVDVYTFNFTSFREAARLRSAILRTLRTLLANNRRFSANLESSGASTQTGFGQAKPEGSQGFVAYGTFTLVCEAYND